MADEQQYSRVRLDLDATEGDLSNPEIDDLYVRAGESYTGNDPAIEAQVRLLAITQLLAAAAKRSDYTQNQSQERQSQVFDHLVKLRAIYQDDLDTAIAAASAAKSNVRWGGLRKKPRRREEYPNEH